MGNQEITLMNVIVNIEAKARMEKCVLSVVTNWSLCVRLTTQ